DAVDNAEDCGGRGDPERDDDDTGDSETRSAAKQPEPECEVTHSSTSLDLHITEVRHRAGADPQPDSALPLRSGFDIVDDQRRLRLIVNVEPCGVALDVDLHFRPLVRYHIDIRFVPGWRLLPQPRPRPVGIGDVLRRVIAPLLIVGAAVGGTKVEGVEGLPV